MILLTAATLYAQQNNADEILVDVKNKLESFQDYQVNLSIKVDMEFLRIPNVFAIVSLDFSASVVILFVCVVDYCFSICLNSCYVACDFVSHFFTW